MTTYKIYLNDRFQINASLTDMPDAKYLLTIDCDTDDMIEAIDMLQSAVDSTLSLLDEHRQKIACNTPGSREMN
jgi:hypothetical protein